MQRILTLFAIVFMAMSALAQPVPRGTAKANLTILTDENMLLPLSRIARRYAIETKTPLTIVVKNAADAENQIEQGLEAHVLITADYPLINRLTEQGLTDVSSRRPIARTQLALVSANDLVGQANIARRISFASILAATPNMPVYASEPTTMEGALVQKLLSEKEFSGALAERLCTEPNHDEVIAALRDEPALGIVLAASAVAEPDIKVVSLLSDGVSPPVTFDVLVLGSEAMGNARNFANYLLTRDAQAMLAHYGYQPPLRQ